MPSQNVLCQSPFLERHSKWLVWYNMFMKLMNLWTYETYEKFDLLKHQCTLCFKERTLHLCTYILRLHLWMRRMKVLNLFHFSQPTLRSGKPTNGQIFEVLTFKLSNLKLTHCSVVFISNSSTWYDDINYC